MKTPSHKDEKPCGFSVETAVFKIAENDPKRAINLATGEVRIVDGLKPNSTWQKVTLKPENQISSGRD